MYLFNQLIPLAGTLILIHVVVGTFADMVCVCYDYTHLFTRPRGYKMEPNCKKKKKKTWHISLYLCSKHKMFFWLIIMKYHKWLRATATKSKTIFNIRHKCFLLVINNGNCCLAASLTAISSSNCQAFYLQLSSQRTHRGEAGFSPLNMPLLSTVWAVRTFLSTRLPSLPDINRVNDTLTDAPNLEAFLSSRNVCFCSWNG